MSNIIELAKFCQERHKNWLAGQEGLKYSATQFFAISEDNSVTLFSSPEDLHNAKQCILVHERLDKAVVHWYEWYKFEFIDANGCIHDSSFDDDFKIWTGCYCTYDRQVMELKYNDSPFYRCERPWDVQIPKIWKLYGLLKETSTYKEKRLTADLFIKEEELLQLKEQIREYESTISQLRQTDNEYRGILRNIDDLIDPIRKSIKPFF